VQGGSTKWKFTSYERDAESGSILDYAQFRFYHSAHGRFMSADPLGGSVSNPQSLNRYAYVRNDPINLIDPLGLYPMISMCTSFRSVWADPEGGYWGKLHVSKLIDACQLVALVPYGGAGFSQTSVRAAPPRKDDCQTFADMVEQIAKQSSNTQQY